MKTLVFIPEEVLSGILWPGPCGYHPSTRVTPDGTGLVLIHEGCPLPQAYLELARGYAVSGGDSCQKRWLDTTSSVIFTPAQASALALSCALEGLGTVWMEES